MNPFFTRCLTFGLIAALTLTTAAASAETVKIAYGDNAIDTARVIKILEGEGFLEVDPSVGYSAELKDITKYNYDIELVPVTSTTLVGTASFINNTYAVPAGFSPKDDAILREVQAEGSENPYRNILAVRTEDVNSDFAQEILEAYHQQNVAEYLLLKYNYANLPAFEYDADSDLYIELVEFDLYNLPNEALHSGDIDMHACVTQTYFESDAAAQGFDDLSLLGYTIIAPLSLYSHKVNSVQELKDLAAK